MTSITWAGPRCVQEAAAILGPQKRTQGRCGMFSVIDGMSETEILCHGTTALLRCWEIEA